ncbi:MAG: winged helix-turn-helix transcriptional regulator [Verrucomicrobia bacterium]|nr:winged helix-turn-helix transcriptional regulator [Verrucomicrobiota bacterium]
MNFLRSRWEHLADYLRDGILQGELAGPLPGMRPWSQQLGVSRSTLEKALAELQREGVVLVLPRGVRINPGRVVQQTKPNSRIVRLLYYARDYPVSHLVHDWVLLFAERLHFHGIQLTEERCDDIRFDAIAQGRNRPSELFLLLSLPSAQQRLFVDHRKPAVVIPEPAPQVKLPFVTVDQVGAIRHATHLLLRRGFSRVCLVVADVRAPGIEHIVSTFHKLISSWPHQPIHARITRLPLELRPMVSTARRFASQWNERAGIIVAPAIPPGIIQTALQERGVTLPGQAEIVAVLPPAQSINLCPPPAHYPFPSNRLVRTLTKVVLHFFETGLVPRVGKIIGVELVKP